MIPSKQVQPCVVPSSLFVRSELHLTLLLRCALFPLIFCSQVVGYIPCLFLVDELLQNVFSNEISGIDAVFKTENVAVTFTVINGQAVFVDVGDYHDRDYDSYEQSIALVDHTLFTPDSPSFVLSFYPNGNFDKVYETNNPKLATVTTVLIIVFTSLAFFLYDSCVRREFHQKRELLQARRQFMRFVSHEVRTPLNSVSMGLQLLQSDLAKALGYESPTSLKSDIVFGENKGGVLQNINETPFNNQGADMKRQREALEWFQLTQEIDVNTRGGKSVV